LPYPGLSGHASGARERITERVKLLVEQLS
jgi:hypothetical protein